MVLFESPVFSRYRDAYLTEDEYLRLQLALISQPTSGDVIPGSGGLRKLRWRGSGRGKRGGIRVIYYYIAADAQIYLLTVYAKAEVKDLTRDQIRSLRKLVEVELK
jgi:mRNA-degrading endonuclease RelE of RelBE toxin-antitoxin system